MIALAPNFLLFQTAEGGAIPLSAEAVGFELTLETALDLAPDQVQQATAAVFHYFQHDLQRTLVTLAEFGAALQKALAGLKQPIATPPAASQPAPLDLGQLAAEAQGAELLFFPRFRAALRQQLDHSPHRLQFHGLRGCVKQLAGAQRWSDRCRKLQDHIIAFARDCLHREAGNTNCTLVIV